MFNKLGSTSWQDNERFNVVTNGLTSSSQGFKTFHKWFHKFNGPFINLRPFKNFTKTV